MDFPTEGKMGLPLFQKKPIYCPGADHLQKESVPSNSRTLLKHCPGGAGVGEGWSERVGLADANLYIEWLAKGPNV